MSWLEAGGRDSSWFRSCTGGSGMDDIAGKPESLPAGIAVVAGVGDMQCGGKLVLTMGCSPTPAFIGTDIGQEEAGAAVICIECF